MMMEVDPIARDRIKEDMSLVDHSSCRCYTAVMKDDVNPIILAQ
jgi:hypothetical protein